MSPARKLALATCEAFPALSPDDRLLLDELEARGHAAHPVRWDLPADWTRFDAVVIRSVWDYHRRIDAFCAWLDELERARVPVLNPVPTLRWNSHKGYLRELAAAGIPTVRTRWVSRGETVSLAGLLREEGWSCAVVKPAISAGAHDLFRVTLAEAGALQPHLDRLARAGEVLIQPFLEEILRDGETSLLYFDRRPSHAVHKRPREGDFRVQLEQGGSAQAITPDPAQLELAQRALAQVPGPLLYARVDLLRVGGEYRLGELELLEPFLFLGFEKGAPTRLADALERLLETPRKRQPA